MVTLEFNGKPCDPSRIEDALLAAALEAVLAQVRDQVDSIRDPDTGEFPTVVIRATSLSDRQQAAIQSETLLCFFSVTRLACGLARLHRSPWRTSCSPSGSSEAK